MDLRLDARGVTFGLVAVAVTMVLVVLGSSGLTWFDAALVGYLFGTLFAVAGMLALFFFAGIGNASTFKQIPMLFEKRQAGGVIGWTAAIGAYGPFIIAGLIGATVGATGDAALFFWGLAVFYALNAGLNWCFYARPGAPARC